MLDDFVTGCDLVTHYLVFHVVIGFVREKGKHFVQVSATHQFCSGLLSCYGNNESVGSGPVAPV